MTDTIEIDAPAAERLASRLLRGPLAVAVAALCLWELATWAPNYLTWPLWADHDVFATAARAWDAGELPYRDSWGNNFPGTIYLFRAFGRLFGFGWPLGVAMYAFDAGLVACLGAALVAWSGRRFGRLLPGLAGYGSFLGYYLALDYSQVAQRDWQGPVLIVVGLLLIQAFHGRGTRWAAAILAAAGLIIRPQAVLFLPAQAFAVGAEARRAGRSPFMALCEWCSVLAIGVAAGFAPIVQAGVWPDFLRSLKVVSYGGKYNLVTARMFLEQMATQLQPLRIDIVPIAILFLWGRATEATRRTTLPWLIALAFVLLYRPMSPHPHTYLSHPLMLVWVALVAALIQMISDQAELPATVRLVAVLLVAGLGLTAKPRFCNPNGSLEAPSILRAGREPGAKPTGYARHPDVPAAGYYEWADYRDVLRHIRENVPTGARVANCLKHVPAITGPTGRLSVFPAESVAWVIVVRDDDVPEFVRRLREAEDAVVVWSPAEKLLPNAPQMGPIFEAIEDHFIPGAKFGAIEVWTRKPGAAVEARP